MRKLFLLLSLVSFLAVSTVTTAAEPTKIEFWTFQELHIRFYEELLKKWNADHPNEQIELVASTFPYDDMHNKLLIALQSGVGAPDLVDVEIGKYANYLRGDIQFLSLNDVVVPELPNIVKARVDIYARDGNYYGICNHVGAAVIYYNTELCEQAGIDWKNIKTWDQYYEAGKKFKAKFPDKYWETVETADPWHMWPLLASAGGDLLDKDGKPTINTPEMAKVLEFNRKLVKEGIATIAPGGFHHTEEFYALMNEGGVASMVMPLWYMGRFTDYMPDLSGKIAVAALPVWEAGQPRSVGMGGTGTSVVKTSEVADLAKRFLAFSKLSREGNIATWNIRGEDPIRTEVWSMPEVLKSSNKFFDYFVTNPFEVLLGIKDEILAINVNEALPATMDMLKNVVLYRAYTEDGSIPEMLADEEANIQY